MIHQHKGYENNQKTVAIAGWQTRWSAGILQYLCNTFDSQIFSKFLADDKSTTPVGTGALL
jgi:hypothetical protein